MLSARVFFMHLTEKAQGFRALALPPGLLEKLDHLGFVNPTPIQRDSIPPALLDKDIIGIAQTGTGKTLAFALPIVANLRPNESALVLAPTRELAIQIEEVFKMLNVSTALLIGGAPMKPQIGQLRAKPSVVIATPGRLLDHMEQKTASLRNAFIVVLDEADRMLDMGFARAVRRILDTVPTDRQTMLFSATMPPAIQSLAQQYLRDPVQVEVDRPGTAGQDVEQRLVVVHRESKATVLEDLLERHPGSILVFARTRHGARKIARHIHSLGHSSAELHSDRTLVQRRAALDGFKSRRFRVLVATDIAARGIDVKEISLVINYDIPENPEDYVHRIGRTGRAGVPGLAITIATPEQHKDVRGIERLLKTSLVLSEGSPLKLESLPAPVSAMRFSLPRRRPVSFKPNAHPPKRDPSRAGRLFGR